MALKWQNKPTDLNLARYGRNLERQVKREATKIAAEMEGYAKVNRPWQDDTGAARSGLRAYVEEHPNLKRVVISHSVDYGIYLELAGGGRFKALLALVRANPAALETVQGGRYAILWSTVEYHILILQARLDAMGLKLNR